MHEGPPKKLEYTGEFGEYKKVIENQADFWFAFFDAKGQFFELKAYLKDRQTQSLEETLGSLKHFLDYTLDRGQTFSQYLLKHPRVIDLFDKQDKLIDRVKTSKDKDDINKYLKESNNLFQMFDLEKESK